MLCSAEDVPEGELVHVDVPGSEWGLVLCRVGGRVLALEDRCTHEDVPLSEGDLILDGRDKCLIECPLHGSAFDIATGHPDVMPATIPAPTFAVDEVDGQILLTSEGIPA